jgi:hypothetical protein
METKEREAYRQKCRYFNNNACTQQTIDNNTKYGWQLITECNGNCLRMKKYDKKIEKLGKEKNGK